MSKQVFLDYASATPLDDEVHRLMEPYLAERFYNPSATYSAAREVKKDIADSRRRVAHWLGCRPAEIVFTAGVTESVNLAILGLMRRYPKAKILVGATEHAAVLEPAEQFAHQLVDVEPSGRIDLADLSRKINDQVTLVSIMYANNETGVINPMSKIADLIDAERQHRAQSGNQLPIYLHTDAAQASNYLDLHVSRLKVDLMSLNGAKIYGPKQSGALYSKGGLELEPLIYGGGQERSLRGGTENVAQIIGFSAALDRAQADRQPESKRLQILRDGLERMLVDSIDGLTINGSKKHRLPNLSNMTIPGIDGERVVLELDEKGIQAATGAACSAGDGESSHVLIAMGKTEAEARGSLRLSLGRHTDQTDIEYAAQQIIELTA